MDAGTRAVIGREAVGVEGAAVARACCSVPRGATRVRELLSGWRGARVHRVPLLDEKGVPVGNNGDRLMVLGTDVVFRELGLVECVRAQDADLIVVASSGGMLEKMRRIPAIFREVSAANPRTPVVVLPSSYHWPTRSVREEIGKREAPTLLMCREAYSHRHLVDRHGIEEWDGLLETFGRGAVGDGGAGAVHSVLDRDMAFELEREAIVMQRRGQGGGGGEGGGSRAASDGGAGTVLIVERTDVEHVSVGMDSRKLGARRTLSGRVPGWLKRGLYPLVNAARARRRTAFRERCEALLREQCPDAVALPRDVADISNVNTCPFEAFCDRIAAARVVLTTRLHVGIFAAMLGRRTFLFDGAYHKIRGIYEHSLAGMEHVTFVENAA